MKKTVRVGCCQEAKRTKMDFSKMRVSSAVTGRKDKNRE